GPVMVDQYKGQALGSSLGSHSLGIAAALVPACSSDDWEEADVRKPVWGRFPREALAGLADDWEESQFVREYTSATGTADYDLDATPSARPTQGRLADGNSPRTSGSTRPQPTRPGMALVRRRGSIPIPRCLPGPKTRTAWSCLSHKGRGPLRALWCLLAPP